MIYRTVLVLLMSIFISGAFAVESHPKGSSAKTDVKDSKPDAASDAKSLQKNAEYWVIRSQSMTELIPLLTKLRTEARRNYRLLTEFIKVAGLVDGYIASDVKAPLNPAEYLKAAGKESKIKEANIKLPETPLTWDQIIEISMKHTKEQGHMPTDVDAKRELSSIKKICLSKEEYGKKVRTELQKLMQQCLDIKCYLESVKKYRACEKFITYKIEEERKAKKDKIKKGRQGLVDARRDRLARERENVWQARQSKLRTSYSGYRW